MTLEIKYDEITEQWFAYVNHKEVTKNKCASKVAKKLSDYLRSQGE